MKTTTLYEAQCALNMSVAQLQELIHKGLLGYELRPAKHVKHNFPIYYIDLEEARKLVSEIRAKPHPPVRKSARTIVVDKEAGARRKRLEMLAEAKKLGLSVDEYECLMLGS